MFATAKPLALAAGDRIAAGTLRMPGRLRGIFYPSPVILEETSHLYLRVTKDLAG